MITERDNLEGRWQVSCYKLIAEEAKMVEIVGRTKLEGGMETAEQFLNRERILQAYRML